MEEKFKNLYDHATSVLQFLTELSANDMEFVLSLASAIFLESKTEAQVQIPDIDVKSETIMEKFPKGDAKEIIARENMYEYFKQISIHCAVLLKKNTSFLGKD